LVQDTAIKSVRRPIRYFEILFSLRLYCSLLGGFTLFGLGALDQLSLIFRVVRLTDTV